MSEIFERSEVKRSETKTCVNGMNGEDGERDVGDESCPNEGTKRQTQERVAR